MPTAEAQAISQLGILVVLAAVFVWEKVQSVRHRARRDAEDARRQEAKDLAADAEHRELMDRLLHPVDATARLQEVQQSGKPVSVAETGERVLGLEVTLQTLVTAQRTYAEQNDARIAALAAKVVELTEKLVELTKQFLDLTKQVVNLSQKVVDLSAEMASKVKKLESDIVDLTAQVDSLTPDKPNGKDEEKPDA